MANKKDKSLEVEVIPEPEKKVEEIAKDLKKFDKRLVEYATIKTPEEYQGAVAFAVEVKARINRIKDLKVEFVKPFKDQIKKLEALFNEPLQRYEDIESQVKQLMGGFLRQQEADARKEEERLRKLREKREERRGEPDPTPLPTVVRDVPTTRTEAGKVTAKKVWKFDIEAYSKLPANVIEEVLYQAQQKGIHEQVIRKMVASGVRSIEGVRIYEDFDTAISA